MLCRAIESYVRMTATSDGLGQSDRLVAKKYDKLNINVRYQDINASNTDAIIYPSLLITNQSTSIPLAFSSSRARWISFISSLCASGTSLNVKTPHPSLKRRYAPNETRPHKGSYSHRPSAQERSSGILEDDFRARYEEDE